MFTKDQLIQALQNDLSPGDTLVLIRGDDLTALTADIESVELGTTPSMNEDEDDIQCIFIYVE